MADKNFGFQGDVPAGVSIEDNQQMKKNINIEKLF
ncbi:hypothetical protein AF74_06300 [Aliarcobacter butzleri L349]|nr:hypothetical protein AF74_06300 [Aliarcobacter butzleri L349]